MKYYVYRHIRLDRNEPFYIGIGTKPDSYHGLKTEYSRAFSKQSRHAAWLCIIAKTNYEVEILFESDDYSEIKGKEREFISLYKSRLFDGGVLVNTDCPDQLEIEKLKRSSKLEKTNHLIILNKRKVVRVDQLDYKGNLIDSFYTMDDLCKKLNKKRSTIFCHLSGRTKSCAWSILKPVFENE